MLFAVTIVIKFILFDVTPSKNKGVTSNTQKIATRLVQEGVLAPFQTPARQKTAHLLQSVITRLPGGDLPLQSSVADPGCLSRILDPDFYPSRIPDLGSQIPDPKTATKERGEKKIRCQTFLCSHKI